VRQDGKHHRIKKSSKLLGREVCACIDKWAKASMEIVPFSLPRKDFMMVEDLIIGIILMLLHIVIDHWLNQ
jgi:hypothetical protein